MHKMEITPKEWKDVEERFEQFDIPEILRVQIRVAMRALNNGDFFYNGTTGDVELGPNGIEEASLLHDYMWALGWGGILSNLIYVAVLKLYKSTKVVRLYRLIFTTLGWWFWGFWKYVWIRNYRPIPERFKELYKDIK